MRNDGMYMNKARVLVVDDEESNCLVIGRALQLLGYDTESALNGRLALELLDRSDFDVMLLDLKMPEMDGEQVLEQVRSLYPGLSVIVLTAHATLESAIKAVKAGAVDYLLKPQKIADIEMAVKRALKRQAAQRQREHLMNVIEEALTVLKDGDEAIDKKIEKSADLIQIDQIVFDPQQRRLTVLETAGTRMRMVELTPVQATIFAYLLTQPQKVVSSNEIAAKALGYTDLSEVEAERIIRPHILRLRRKIEENPENPQFIRSIRGKGYCFSTKNSN